jgi:hypothetical protein
LPPRWASRITLEITGIRVERLQDISEEDAAAEGIERLYSQSDKANYPNDNRIQSDQSWANYLWHGHVGRSITQKQSDLWHWQYSNYKVARDSFSSLWASINGLESWSKNPWVWVVEFRRIKP